MKRMVAVGKTMLLVGVNNMSNLKEEKMNVTRLTVVIRTYQGDTYRNNIVRIGLPKEAAEIIARYWQSNPKSLADCVKAVALGKNQSADLELAIDNKRVSGYENISVQQRVNDEWSYRELEEE